MSERPLNVYVIQGRGQRDYGDCQRALDRVPAHLETPPHAAYFSSPAVAQVPRRCGEEVARVLTKERPVNVVNGEVYAPGHRRRGP